MGCSDYGKAHMCNHLQAGIRFLITKNTLYSMPFQNLSLLVQIYPLHIFLWKEQIFQSHPL